MRIDLHTHCKWSKHSELSPQYLKDMLTHASRHLDVMALTEHFDTLQFERIYDELEQLADYENGHFTYKGLVILPGIEVDVAEGGHIIVIGELAVIRKLSRTLNQHREPSRFITLEQLLSTTRSLNCVCIGAHPFREENRLSHVAYELLRQLDGIDLNGRDLYKYGLDMERRLKILAQQLELPIIAGSDTHHYEQYGSVVSETEGTVRNTAELRQLLQTGSWCNRIAEDYAAKVQRAEQQQKLIKQAGDYQSKTEIVTEKVSGEIRRS